MLGIAVGSQSTVVGVKKGAGVEIVLSLTSKRDNPTMITFGQKERSYGALSQEIMKSHINSTVFYASRYLGLQPEWNNGKYLEEERKFALANPIVDTTFNRLCFDIDYKGTQEFYYPEDIMGTFFNKLKKQFQGVCQDDKSVCVTVPDYFTLNERQAMIDAVKMADLKLIHLVNESSANCLNYGMSRRAQFDEKEPRIVAFVDIGHSKTSIFFGQFGRNTQKVISITNERNLGARDFDYALVQYYSEKFQKKHGCNPMKNKKCIIRMIDVLTKCRKILTGNTETTVSIESLMEDEDLYYTLTRQEFEGVIQPVTDKIREVLAKALENSKLKIEQIHSVEMVGDAVRTPIIQTIIKEVFNKDVSKTLAPDESQAIGSALFAALSSPFFHLKDYVFEHYNNYTILLEYPFMKDGQVQIRTHKLIAKGDHFPAKKTIKFTEKQVPNEPVINLKLGYSPEEAPHLSNHVIRAYSVVLPKITSDKFEFVLNFGIDANGFPSIEKGTINEYWFEEAPVDPKEKEKEKESKDNKMDVDEQVKKVKKEKPTACIVNLVEQNFGLSVDLLEKISKREAKQEQDDIDIKAVHSKRNEIEQFIYGTRQKLDDQLKAYITDSEKKTLIEQMDALEQWFYSDDPEIEIMSVLTAKSEKLNSLGSTIYKRLHEWEAVTAAMENLSKTITTTEAKANADHEALTKKDPNVRLNQQEIQDLYSAVELYKDKFKESSALLSKGLRTDLPGVSAKSVKQYTEDFNKKTLSIYQTAENRFLEAKRKEEERLKKEKEEREKAEKEAKQKAESENKPKEETKDPKEPKKDLNMDVD